VVHAAENHAPGREAEVGVHARESARVRGTDDRVQGIAEDPDHVPNVARVRRIADATRRHREEEVVHGEDIALVQDLVDPDRDVRDQDQKNERENHQEDAADHGLEANGQNHTREDPDPNRSPDRPSQNTLRKHETAIKIGTVRTSQTMVERVMIGKKTGIVKRTEIKIRIEIVRRVKKSRVKKRKQKRNQRVKKRVGVAQKTKM